MKMWHKIIKAGIPVAAGLLFTAAANAAVVYPMLDIQQYGSGTDVTSTATSLVMDGTAFAIIYSATSNWPGFPDQPFSLSSDASGVGTLSVGNGSILSASFSKLNMNPTATGVGYFTADLTFTGGSMATTSMTGRIEGSFFNATGPGPIALGSTFYADNLIAKIGKVQTVPVPAAVWLFGSGLLGLLGIAKRKKAA